MGLWFGLCCNPGVSKSPKSIGGLVIFAVTVCDKPVPPCSNGSQVGAVEANLHAAGRVWLQRFPDRPSTPGRGAGPGRMQLTHRRNSTPRSSRRRAAHPSRYYRTAICDPHVSTCLIWIISLLPFSASDADMAVNLLANEAENAPARRWILPAMLL